MDTIDTTNTEYPVQPGCRYAVAFEAVDACSVSLAWLSAPGATPQNWFILADGTNTEAYALSAGAAVGWEIVAPTGTLYIESSAEAKVAITKIQH